MFNATKQITVFVILASIIMNQGQAAENITAPKESGFVSLFNGTNLICRMRDQGFGLRWPSGKELRGQK